ncbi:mechanosensitive ion channel protein MscS [Pontibacter fetidus]|uniref:Mechanosensitive ion channel protein MscS n=1 Tax=Pontibacter fetidus TaxID=2700082 RepID=A0A6B2H299_9BACT|nr:mechanosensitive ion channel protein MscS [Pontibacter fetidus]NDK56238.1 mechanosensitive ion channel protein MscS [Pontibacter fetidus]
MLLKNIFYAILLGVGMAACLSQNEKQKEGETAASVIEEAVTETPAQPTAPSPEQLQIGPDRVGFVTIGQDIKQMRQNIPSGFSITDTTLQQEGMQSTAYIIRPEQQAKGFLVEQQCDTDCKVWRLKVTSEEYKTPKGIHVGATYAQAQQAHPINTVTLADGGLVAVAKEGGITFVLNAEQVPAAQRGRLTPTTVPADTRVKAILIY